MDAGSYAAVGGHLTAFRQELVFYDVAKVSLLFLGEAVIGDELRVACWQDAENVGLLNFEVLNASKSKVSCQCQIEFANPQQVAQSKL